MSCNLSVSNDSSVNRYIPEMVSTDTIDYPLLFDHPFSPFQDSSSDYNFQDLLNNSQNQQNPFDESSCPDQFVSGLLPSSPPTDQLENLSLYQTTQYPSLSFSPNLEYGYGDFNGLNYLEVKNEECQVDFDPAYRGVDNVDKYLQRSFSSNSFEGKPGFSFQLPFDSLMESQNFQGQSFSMPESSFFAGQMRKVCSTGDLENMRNAYTNPRSISTPSAIENSFMEEAPFKVGRYSAEERQERISKYKAKRNQRNFNKTIKYACRKTLADNRPRIRGRFARNDDTVEVPKAACSTRDEDEDGLWVLHSIPHGSMQALQEVEDETTARGSFMSSFSQTQYQHHHGCF
ncbi:PREDICTED: zinc finger protein CONSTANS isoform X1 [Theobroma cacao]|uniref:Zinc finger protein CONSTANS isoform X1 n=1 Tax=Theobroma cacao TaxID=3641 RepID=A0AB32W1J6_THECC|nr:PREDICTED: zinc finger protein CONSTANS isoform X1 [Theobroma cacao]